MSGYLAVFLSLGILSPLSLAGGAFDCAERQTLLTPITGPVQLTDCLLECTGMTYVKKLQLQDEHNIQFTDSTEGDLGEYCWSTELKCTVGESFQHAYVVLPMDLPAADPGRLQVLSAASTLHIHSSPTAIADSCGLRYDVTGHFSPENRETLFCVNVVNQQGASGDSVLKCPPYLVTFWQRNQNL